MEEKRMRVSASLLVNCESASVRPCSDDGLGEAAVLFGDWDRVA
jgi:hypothetical protein